MAAKRRKRCSEEGCRRLQVAGSLYCADHASKAAASPDEGTIKLTEIEALRFGKMDAEMRNILQGIQLVTLEAEKVQREAQDKLRTLEGNKRQLKDKLQSIKPGYTEFVTELAEKYGVEDPSKMSLDPDTGTVRDLGR